MPQIKITEMPEGVGLNEGDVFPIVQFGANKQIPISLLTSYLEGLGVFATAAEGDLASNSLPKNYWVDTGAVNNVVITPNPVMTAHAAGIPIWFKAANTNTGATTISINGLPAATIKKLGVALDAGDIQAGQICQIMWDGASYQLTVIGGVGFGNFANLKADPGYFKLPGGIIVQWGSFTVNVASAGTVATTVAFPTPFSTACLTGLATFAIALPSCSTGFNMVDAAHGSVSISNGTGATLNIGVRYVAIGY